MALAFYAIIISCFALPWLAQAGEMTANQIQRDPYGMVIATGQVRLQSKGYEIHADSMRLDVDSQAGDMSDAKVLFDQGYTLKGSKLHRIDLEVFHGKDVEFSSCPEDDWAWSILADEAELNREEGIFTAKSAWFEWGGVPVLYTPRWQHALSRRSGFLTPQFSQSERRGSEVILPFYWAAAPNWDMTLSPNWMSRRGLMSDVEWRHRSAQSHKQLRVRSVFDKETQTQRSRILSDMAWNPLDTVRVSLNVDAVDDGLHVADFPLLDELESKAYLTSSAAIAWQEERDRAELSTRYQQVLGGASNVSTLQILPRLETRNYVDVGREQVIQIDHQTTQFQRDVGASGLRVGLRPSWTIPWYMQGGAVVAKWSVLGQFVGYDSKQFSSTNASYDALASSLALEATFERISEDKTWRHEIKPIVRLDVSNAPDQSALPVYDSGLAPLSMGNILQGNRYSGWDRFERMRRVSALLASSLQTKDDQGHVRTVLQGQVGMVWDDLQESVDTIRVAQPERRTSNVLAEMAWAPHQMLNISVGGQRDTQLNQWVESHAGLNWSGPEQQYFNAGWRNTKAAFAAETKTLSASGKVNLNQRWSSHLTTNYDLLNGYTLNMVAGIEYKHACWSMMIERFQTYQVGSTGQTDVGGRFLLEFDGLGSFGG